MSPQLLFLMCQIRQALRQSWHRISREASLIAVSAGEEHKETPEIRPGFKERVQMRDALEQRVPEWRRLGTQYA